MKMHEIVKFAECALGTDNHLLQNALGLSCGHFVCKKCIPANNNYQFKCLKCNETNQYNLSLGKEPELLKFYMQNHLKILSTVVNEKIEIEMEILKSKLLLKTASVLLRLIIC